MSGNGDTLVEAMERLMDDDRFVQATLRAAEITASTGNEAEYRVLEGEGRIVGPNVGGKHVIRIPGSVGSFAYLGHTHPGVNRPYPSQQDLDLIDLDSRKGTPIEAVWTNCGDYVLGVAFRNRKSVSEAGICLTLARRLANYFLPYIGLQTHGFTSSKYRRYISRCKKGDRETSPDSIEVLDIVPKALHDAGYEAVSMVFPRGYKTSGKG
ncbi:MAG: hypothetical protein FJY76_03075 [Candidatus Aenigmarchaeota archaeon]|nr:hypothetical protein [Candidatus Aenigmarchaeota archaeon]